MSELFGRLILSGTWLYSTLRQLVLGGCYDRARAIVHKPCPHFLRAGCRPTADIILPRFDMFGRLMRSALLYAGAPFPYSACLFWVDRVYVSYSFVVTHVLEDIITLDCCPYLGRRLWCAIVCSNDPCPHG